AVSRTGPLYPRAGCRAYLRRRRRRDTGTGLRFAAGMRRRRNYSARGPGRVDRLYLQGNDRCARTHMTVIARSNKLARAAYRPSMALVPEVLAGRNLSIARMISRAEAGYAEATDALAEIYKYTGKAHIIG